MPKKRLCDACKKEYTYTRASSKYCSPSCRYDNHLVNSKRFTIPQDLRFTILERDEFRCRYCGAEPVHRQLRVDHVVSLKEGGGLTDMDNLVTTCFECNAGKADRDFDPAKLPRGREWGDNGPA